MTLLNQFLLYRNKGAKSFTKSAVTKTSRGNSQLSKYKMISSRKRIPRLVLTLALFDFANYDSALSAVDKLAGSATVRFIICHSVSHYFVQTSHEYLQVSWLSLQLGNASFLSRLSKNEFENRFKLLS